MKQSRVIFALFLTLSSQALGGTYTVYSTRIPVPASADGATNGDTSASSTNSIHLDANVYVPDGAVAPTPAVVVIHGFGETKSTATIVTFAEDFAAAGYVVVTPTVRGFGNSEGLVSLVGPNEVNDLKTIILAMQAGSIGDTPPIAIPVTSASKVGVMGPSYGGGHTFEIMRTHVAGLTAVIPIIGWTDLYQALAPNDVPKLTYSLGLFATGFNFEDPNYAPVMFDWLRDILNGTPEATRQGDPESNIDWRSVIFNPTELTVPAFVIQGWDDDLFPAEQALQLVQTNNSIPFLKLYIGGLGHPPASLSITGNEGVYLRAQAVRWFDLWLKGIDNGITNEPPITFAPGEHDELVQQRIDTGHQPAALGYGHEHLLPQRPGTLHGQPGRECQGREIAAHHRLLILVAPALGRRRRGQQYPARIHLLGECHPQFRRDQHP
jgi:pimeloyl-ACP methyl ester carboxylesterase